MNNDFDDRLQRAIQRGQRKADSAEQAARADALSEEELRRRHGQYRLQLSEHIEHCVSKLPHYFPGFQYETVVGERGWGAACSRDDVRMQSGRRGSDYSRLELTVRPFSPYHVLDLTAKGTIRNKEVYNRSHFEKIADADPRKFMEIVDLWVLEFAELYAAKN
jgi:hypothetical protein